MNKKTDIAWLSLFFGVPGFLLIIFFYLPPLFDSSAFEIFFGRPPVEIEGIVLALPFFGLGALQFILLIPAWLLLRKSENVILARTIKVFFTLLALFLVSFMVFPIFDKTERYLIIAGTIPLILAWLLITGRFRKIG